MSGADLKFDPVNFTYSFRSGEAILTPKERDTLTRASERLKQRSR